MYFFFFVYLYIWKRQDSLPASHNSRLSEDEHGEDLEYQSHKKQESSSDEDMESEEDNNLESLP